MSLWGSEGVNSYLFMAFLYARHSFKQSRDNTDTHGSFSNSGQTVWDRQTATRWNPKSHLP